jgi:hypothetical protein
VWRVVSATGLAVAAVTSLGYAGWVVTARRVVFADIADFADTAGADGSGPVTLAAARSSDAAESAWGWATALLVAAALLLWCGARYLGGRRLGPVGFAGLALLGVGLAVSTLGSAVAATAAGEPAEAGRAALGSAVIGAGLLMVSLGLFTGVASVLRAPRAAYLGYAGWSTG